MVRSGPGEEQRRDERQRSSARCPKSSKQQRRRSRDETPRGLLDCCARRLAEAECLAPPQRGTNVGPRSGASSTRAAPLRSQRIPSSSTSSSASRVFLGRLAGQRHQPGPPRAAPARALAPGLGRSDPSQASGWRRPRAPSQNDRSAGPRRAHQPTIGCQPRPDIINLRQARPLAARPPIVQRLCASQGSPAADLSAPTAQSMICSGIIARPSA